MTWVPGSTWRSLLVPAIGALASLALLVACFPGQQPAKPQGPPRCADLIAHAMTTQAPQPVVGAYACFAPDIAAQAVALGITDDETFSQYAAGDPVITGYKYAGKSKDPQSSPVYYYFSLTPQQCFRVSVNEQGLVDGGSFGPQGAACPDPRP